MRRDGEYMMEMYSVDYPFPRYHVDYLKNFIAPLHIITVGGVPILKIWKNDMEHTKPGFLQEVEQENVQIRRTQDGLEVAFQKPARLTRIIIDHTNTNCLAEGSGVVSYTADGKKEFRTPDDLYRAQGRYADSLKLPTRFVYFFTGQLASVIRIVPDDNNLCLLQYQKVRVFSLYDK